MVDKRLEIDIVANDRASRPIKNLQSTIIRFVGAVSASLAALRAVVFPINSAREFERVLRDVQKTTGFVNSEIEILGQQLLNLSRRVDTSANDLGRIAAAAGQLGLGEAGGQAIVQFTESIARAATTLDLTAEQAATSFAKIGSIFNIPIQNTERLISTINELSNTTTATADQLLDVVRRVGTVAGSFEDVAALAAQAIQLGLSPETAGTSLVKIFSRFESDADKFAESFGITVGEFLGKGAIERWEFYLGELAKLSEDEAAKLINTLSGSGRIFALVDKQVQDAKNGFDIFRNAQENARRSFEEGTSAIEEYASISQSLDVQLKILRNNFAALGTELGLRLVPTLIETVQRLQEFLQTERARVFFDNLGQGLIQLVNLFERFVNVITSLPAGALADIFQVGFILAAVTAIRGAIRGFLSILQSWQATLAATAQRTQDSFNRIRAAAADTSGGIIAAFQRQRAAVVESGQAVARSVTVYEGATAALGAYASATNTAAVAQAGLAQAATRAQQASLAGAGAQSAVGAGTAQQRVAALQQELQLIAKKRADQEAIVAAANKEIANLKARAAILAKADRLTGQRNAISRRGLEVLTQQKIQQEAIIAGANRRLASLTQIGVSLRAQLLTVQQIAAAQTAAAAQAEIADKKRIANLGLITRLQLSFNAALNGTALGGLRASGALTKVAFGLGTVARGLRVLTPVVRVATAAFRAFWAAVGGPVGLIITLIVVFGEQLKALYDRIVGNTRRAEAELTEIVRIQARRRQGLINQQIADLERLQKTLSTGPRLDIDIEVAELDTASTLAEQQKFLDEAGDNLNKYGRAAAGAGAQIELLKGQILAAEQAQAEYNDELNKATGAEFQALLAAQTANEEAITKFNIQLRETIRLQENLQKGAQAAADEIVQGLTIGTFEAIKLQKSFVDSRDRLGELETRAKQIGALNIQAKIGAEFDEAELGKLGAQLAEIFDDETFRDLGPEALIKRASQAVQTLQTDIAGARQEVSDFERAASGAVEALSPTQRQFVDANKILDARSEELGLIIDTQKASGRVLKVETEREAFLRNQAPRILAQKFAYDEILKSLEKTQKAAEENRKAAQGIFDNTAAEARALNQELENTQRNLDKILRLRVRERDLGRDIEKGQEGIEDLTQEIADLEQQLVDTTDVYQRNKIRARIEEAKSKRNLEETLLIERQRERATLGLTDFFEQLPGLTAEAKKAAQEGQVAPLQAIKDQIDQGIKDADAAIADLANLQDAEGNFLFREDEIQDFKDALDDASGDYTEALPEINRTLKDAAEAAERAVAEQIKTFNAQNKELLEEFKDLVDAFPGIAESLEVVRQQWEKTNQPLIKAIENFGTRTQASLLGGQGLPAGLGRQIEDLTFDATKAATRAITDSFGNPTTYAKGIEAALGGANLNEYITKLREATGEGIDSVKIDEQGNFYGQVKDISVAAIDAALEEVRADPDAIARRRTDALPPSEQVRQRLEPEVFDADPTAATLAAVRAQLTAAQSAVTEATAETLKSPEVKDALKNAGGNVAVGIVEGAKKLGLVGALVGASVGAAKDLIDILIDEAKKQLRIPGTPVPVQTRAQGGLISGPGTGTSDSILARLSDGEYVSDARTVSHFGPAFFAALKRMARGSNTVTNRLDRDIPAFARGGLVTGGSSLAPVNINLPGVGSFPMLAETNTIDQVSRAAERERLKRGRRNS